MRWTSSINYDLVEVYSLAVYQYSDRVEVFCKAEFVIRLSLLTTD